MSKYEAVNHPTHYGGGANTYEHIKVVEALGFGYHLGNCTKYIWRAGKKDGASAIIDLKKAAFYLSRYIQLLERDAQTPHHSKARRRNRRGA